MDADRWSASLRPADDRRPAVAGAIGDELSSSPIGITRGFGTAFAVVDNHDKAQLDHTEIFVV